MKPCGRSGAHGALDADPWLEAGSLDEPALAVEPDPLPIEVDEVDSDPLEAAASSVDPSAAAVSGWLLELQAAAAMAARRDNDKVESTRRKIMSSHRGCRGRERHESWE
jgi:hypothetical protein